MKKLLFVAVLLTASFVNQVNASAAYKITVAAEQQFLSDLITLVNDAITLGYSNYKAFIAKLDRWSNSSSGSITMQDYLTQLKARQPQQEIAAEKQFLSDLMALVNDAIALGYSNYKAFIATLNDWSNSSSGSITMQYYLTQLQARQPRQDIPAQQNQTGIPAQQNQTGIPTSAQQSQYGLMPR